MLNKDQYNQDEYNDYYRQETEGAEIGGSDEESGIISKLIILLVILALSIAAYFGYKTINNSQSDEIDSSLQVSAESTLPQNVQNDQKEEHEKIIEEESIPAEAIQEEPIKQITMPKPKVVVQEKVEVSEPKSTETKTAVTTQDTVTKVVNNAVTTTQGKMSPEEIAAVVAAVMQQMNQVNKSTSSTAIKQDITLMNELSDSEVDSVSEDLIKELEGMDISENTKIDNSEKQVDVYNKVNVQDVSGEDTLSQLSNEINSVIKEGIEKDTTVTYTQSLKSEVNVRKNEMRIIVVRKGDTLGRIAKRAYGNVMAYEKIYRANPEVTRPDRIYIGQKLRIPN